MKGLSALKCGANRSENFISTGNPEKNLHQFKVSSIFKDFSFCLTTMTHSFRHCVLSLKKVIERPHLQIRDFTQ